MPKKKSRLGVYALVIIVGIAVSIIDGVDPGLIDQWLDQGSRLAGVAAAVLAIFNLKDDQTKTPTGQ